MWRLAQIQPLTAFNPVASAQRIVLPTTQKIRELFLYFNMSTGATAPTRNVVSDISGVQVIANGSRDIVNLSGPELLLTEYLSDVPVPYVRIGAAVNTTYEYVLPIRFWFPRDSGRNFLNTRDFTDVSLIVYSNAGTGGSTTTSLSMAVWGLLEGYDETREFAGFRRLVAIDRYTSASSGDKSTLIPIAYRLVSIYHLVPTTNVAYPSVFTRTTLDLDDKQFILVDGETKPLNYITTQLNNDYYITGDNPTSLILTTAPTFLTIGSGTRINTDQYTHAWDALQTRQYSRIRLTGTQAYSGATVTVVTEELVEFPF